MRTTTNGDMEMDRASDRRRMSPFLKASVFSLAVLGAFAIVGCVIGHISYRDGGALNQKPIASTYPSAQVDAELYSTFLPVPLTANAPRAIPTPSSDDQTPGVKDMDALPILPRAGGDEAATTTPVNTPTSSVPLGPFGFSIMHSGEPIFTLGRREAGDEATATTKAAHLAVTDFERFPDTPSPVFPHLRPVSHVAATTTMSVPTTLITAIKSFLKEEVFPRPCDGHMCIRNDDDEEAAVATSVPSTPPQLDENDALPPIVPTLGLGPYLAPAVGDEAAMPTPCDLACADSYTWLPPFEHKAAAAAKTEEEEEEEEPSSQLKTRHDESRRHTFNNPCDDHPTGWTKDVCAAELEEAAVATPSLTANNPVATLAWTGTVPSAYPTHSDSCTSPFFC